jgi:hypothetical protein
VSAVEAPVRLGIDLGGNSCFEDDCVAFAHNLHLQMNSGKYDVCATMPLPRSREAWEAEHRTARKRAWKATAQGYDAGVLLREKWEWDIHQINTSRPKRQGRPMTAGYQHMTSFDPLPDYPCDLHAIRCYGVWMQDLHLVAYLVIYRAGDLALVSQVLGHADHEPNGVMYLLFRHALEAEGAIAPGVCVYNRWDSGTDGLRFLKARIGFEETAVEWLP